MEYISIHCKDVQVIKKLIDFSMFSTYYKVISISTLSIHLYEDIDYCTVFVIQKDVIKDVHSFFKQLKKRYLNSIAIVYICDELDDYIEEAKGEAVWRYPTKIAIILERLGRIEEAIDLCAYLAERGVIDTTYNNFEIRRRKLLKKLI